ncbi:MAG: FHA domain-containing protein, partial [Planctomycetes bacterium]|nr:FHA domain-containing protein [Planctomycetota bacterium]
MPHKLLVKEGQYAGRSFWLTAAKTTMGRDPASTLPLLDGKASRNHCEIENVKGVLKIRDLDSRNGTIVNGLSVKEAELRPGDEIRVGSSTFQIVFEEPNPDLQRVAMSPPKHDDPRQLAASVPMESARYVAAAAEWPAATTEQGAKHLKALCAAANQFHVAGTLEALFEQLADAGLAATGMARAVVLLPQPPATDLTPHSVRRAAKQDPAFIEIAKSFAERAMGESMAMLVRLQPSVSLYVPIRGSEETHGVLYLEGEGGEGLGEEDLQLLMGVAHQAGLALEHLRARQESAERGGHWLRTLRTERILVGKSEPMKAVFNRLLKAAASDAPVLLRGEPGTGKELAARFIYLHGARHDSPFVAINFATLPTEQHEAALFGGVPPGADKDHPGSTAKPPLPGAFQEAMAGTLLLAEIGQLSEQAQDRLVTALLEGRVAGTPSAKEPAATVRVIAATSKRLERLVAQGQFRSEIHCQ